MTKLEGLEFQAMRIRDNIIYYDENSNKRRVLENELKVIEREIKESK